MARENAFALSISDFPFLSFLSCSSLLICAPIYGFLFVSFGLMIKLFKHMKMRCFQNVRSFSQHHLLHSSGNQSTDFPPAFTFLTENLILLTNLTSPLMTFYSSIIFFFLGLVDLFFSFFHLSTLVVSFYSIRFINSHECIYIYLF